MTKPEAPDSHEAEPEGAEAAFDAEVAKPEPPKQPPGVVLFLLGVLAGAALLKGVEHWGEPDPPDPNPPPAEGRSGSSALRDLDDKPVTFVPSGTVRLVNVWLERCADCMPHFEAWKRVVDEDQLPPGVPIVNVAYRRATRDFAAQYRVADNLAIDPEGAAVVRPNRIDKFTTIVVSPTGRECHRGHPASPHYAEDLRAAVATCDR